MVARSDVWHVRDHELWGRAPEAFEIVIAPRLLAEDVQNEAAKIDQRPFRGTAPFSVFRRAMKMLFKLLFHFAAYCLHLRRAESRADHEEVREGADVTKIENGDSCRFFILRSFNSQSDALWQSFKFQRYRPCLRMYSSTRTETSP